ncbi:hypothetical protein CANCADRAFT_81976 [Tortispora caseinolytica NRRL Y-17796]|uniref:Uncharacterized protein n=1 Tax=Tortispora caseinolytica NRRL Y-17796 TaxID=767744 RepID=A0A1E4TJZ2_9ASCO|nr:hypothetical protein CANCADRAFT_81976 [Tortispora caseinolytica NRRL Y-17796]
MRLAKIALLLCSLVSAVDYDQIHNVIPSIEEASEDRRALRFVVVDVFNRRFLASGNINGTEDYRMVKTPNTNNCTIQVNGKVMQPQRRMLEVLEFVGPDGEYFLQIPKEVDPTASSDECIVF